MEAQTVSVCFVMSTVGKNTGHVVAPSCSRTKRCCLHQHTTTSSATNTDLRSYLAGYVLTVEVMTIERGLRSWKSVQGCSVESEESATQPAALTETIVMTQVS